MFSLSIKCNGSSSCDTLDLYCPVTADCVFECEGDASNCYGANIFLYDPDGAFDESLMDISCEPAAECVIIEHWCTDEEYLDCTVDSWAPLVPLSCSADIALCQACHMLMFR